MGTFIQIKKEERIHWLDVLRGLAILLVILFHFTCRYAQKYPAQTFVNIPFFQVRFGWIGVYLFFMISGFIIYLTIQSKAGFFDFLVSRLSRLLPPFWAAIFLIVLLEQIHYRLFGFANRNTLGVVLLNMAMVPDLFHVHFLDGAFWSLFVEIKFYIFFALLWRVADMKKKRNFYLSFFILGILIVFHNHVHQLPLGDSFNYFPIFWAGIAACKTLKENLSLIEYGIITALVSASTMEYYKDGMELLISIPIFSSLFVLSEKLFKNYLNITRILSPIVFLGRISYSYYLIHQPVGYIILGSFAALALNYNLAILTSFTICLITALFGFRYIEQLDKRIAAYVKNKTFHKFKSLERCL